MCALFTDTVSLPCPHPQHNDVFARFTAECEEFERRATTELRGVPEQIAKLALKHTWARSILFAPQRLVQPMVDAGKVTAAEWRAWILLCAARRALDCASVGFVSSVCPVVLLAVDVEPCSTSVDALNLIDVFAGTPDTFPRLKFQHTLAKAACLRLEWARSQLKLRDDVSRPPQPLQLRLADIGDPKQFGKAVLSSELKEIVDVEVVRALLEEKLRCACARQHESRDVELTSTSTLTSRQDGCEKHEGQRGG